MTKLGEVLQHLGLQGEETEAFAESASVDELCEVIRDLVQSQSVGQGHGGTPLELPKTYEEPTFCRDCGAPVSGPSDSLLWNCPNCGVLDIGDVGSHREERFEDEAVSQVIDYPDNAERS
jgi:predicted RNA-binding Zn-ribbon protein involved in translation (DUF1610 family)